MRAHLSERSGWATLCGMSLLWARLLVFGSSAAVLVIEILAGG